MSKVRAGGHLYHLAPTGSPGRPGVEPPGRWVGRGAERLELAGAVDPAQLEAVLCARHPWSGDPLGAGRGRVSVTAFDLTFCAPKSVSLLHALGPAEVADAVRAGHDEAVRTALGYVEGHALAVRRMQPAVGRVPVPVDPSPAAAFLHRTSRDLDPHLHQGREGERQESGQETGDREGRSRERRPDRGQQRRGRRTGDSEGRRPAPEARAGRARGGQRTGDRAEGGSREPDYLAKTVPENGRQTRVS